MQIRENVDMKILNELLDVYINICIPKNAWDWLRRIKSKIEFSLIRNSAERR